MTPPGRRFSGAVLKSMNVLAPYLSGARRKMLLRCASLTLLVLLALTLNACSYLVDFVVVNESSQPLEIHYKLKHPPSSLAVPSVMPASKLDESDRYKHWQELGSDRYQFDQMTNIVAVRLMPGEAMRVLETSDSFTFDDANAATYFEIEEITLNGTGGELKLSGAQAYKHFAEVSYTLRKLTYK